MDTTTDIKQLQAGALVKLGSQLQTKLGTYQRDRRLKELQAMKDLRQYQGKYDIDVEGKLDDKRSKVYPRDTRHYLFAFTAKMMEMMFPAQEKNWTLTPSEHPNIELEDLQSIIAKLTDARMAQYQQAQQAAMAAQQQGQQVEPVPPPPEITAEDIEEAVKAFAKERAAAMEAEIADQLEDMEPAYPVLCKRALHAGAVYGIGVLAGPFTVWQVEHTFEKGLDGSWGPVERRIPRPTMETCRWWDIYPDLSAKSWNAQEGLFHRKIMSRHQLLKLTQRDDFYGEVIKEWLKINPDGNYKAETYDRELNLLDSTQNVTQLDGRRYEVHRYLGFVSARQLADIGVSIPEAELYKDLLCDIWLLNDKVIKAMPVPFGDHVGDHYHPFIYNDEEEAGLLGISLPQDVRDSQMKLCSLDRMLMDNAATVCGPITTIDESRLSRKRKDAQVEIGAFTTIYIDRSESPQDNSDVVKEIQVNSHIAELLAARKQFEQQFELECGIPAWTMGATPEKLGEAFRTSGNMSQMNGGANMITKDQVRAFDRMTASVIGSMVKWNMLVNEKKEIKGDFQVVARGSISLVAKEVRGAALDQFMNTLTPEERVILKTRDTLVERLRSRDLPLDIILPEKEAQAAIDQFRQSQAQQSQAQMDNLSAKTQKDGAAAQLNAAKAQEIQATTNAKIGELAARAQGTLAKVKGDQDAHQLETLKLLLEQINAAAGEGGSATQGTGGAQ